MRAELLYGTGTIAVEVPDGAAVYASSYPPPPGAADATVLAAIRQPRGTPPLSEMLAGRRNGDVVIVVSDITRPIPYAHFLGAIVQEIIGAGVPAGDILILIATGMHRPSTPAERRAMFGEDICSTCRIIDHRSDDDAELVELDGTSWSGNRIRLNRHFVAAGFRIVTGLVEPHFMAGFSGGRKSVCPGLVSIDTVGNFHGYEFLADPAARNAQLRGNPCHQEALSVARMAGVDFALSVVLNHERQVVRAFAGELELSHGIACEFARRYACPEVAAEHDVVLTSCGGYPLDATFYQCVKGMVSCLPAVKRGGAIVSAGSCSEGVGSAEFREMMLEYSGRGDEFLEWIRTSPRVVRDQWELQMQLRAVVKVGPDNLFFATDGLPEDEVRRLSVRAAPDAADSVEQAVQKLLDGLLNGAASLAVIPEGPYCAPVEQGSAETWL